MVLTKISQLTGREHSMEIPITKDELFDYYRSGILIQHYFPKLSEDHREFIMSGITPDEWKTYVMAGEVNG